MVFIFSCEDAKRDWDNPYDPRSNRSLWTPDSLKIVQKSENEIQLSWLRRGRDFDGFIIDKNYDDKVVAEFSISNIKDVINQLIS